MSMLAGLGLSLEDLRNYDFSKTTECNLGGCTFASDSERDSIWKLLQQKLEESPLLRKITLWCRSSPVGSDQWKTSAEDPSFLILERLVQQKKPLEEIVFRSCSQNSLLRILTGLRSNLGHLVTLVVDLDQDHDLSTSCMQEITMMVKESHVLKSLTLKSCGLGKKDNKPMKKALKEFGAVLAGCRLEILNLEANNMSSERVLPILRGVKANTTLKEFILLGNRIDNESCLLLKRVIRKRRFRYPMQEEIFHLELSHNRIKSEDARALSKALIDTRVFLSLHKNAKILKDLQKGIQYHNDVLNIMQTLTQERGNYDPFHLTFTTFLNKKGINLMEFLRPFFLLLNKANARKLKENTKKDEERPRKRRKITEGATEEKPKSPSIHWSNYKSQSHFDWLPTEIMIHILSFVSIADLFQIAKCCHAMSEFASSNVLWRKFCLNRSWAPKDESIMTSSTAWKDWFRGHMPFFCFHCGVSSQTVSWFGFYNIFICRNCQVTNDKYAIITAPEAAKYHSLKDSELNKLRYITKPSHYPTNAKLFLVSDVTEYIKQTRIKKLNQL